MFRETSISCATYLYYTYGLFVAYQLELWTKYPVPNRLVLKLCALENLEYKLSSICLADLVQQYSMGSSLDVN